MTSTVRFLLSAFFSCLTALTLLLVGTVPAEAGVIAQDRSRPFVETIYTQPIKGGFTANSSTFRNPRSFSLIVGRVTTVFIYDSRTMAFKGPRGTRIEASAQCGWCAFGPVSQEKAPIYVGECAMAVSWTYDPTNLDAQGHALVWNIDLGVSPGQTMPCR